MTCYTTYFINNNSNYNEAYYDMKYLQIFATSKDKVIISTSSPGTATTTTSPTARSGAAAGIGAFNSAQGWASAMVRFIAGLFAFLG